MKIQSNAMDRIRQLQNRSLRETVGLQEAPSTPAENKAKADEFVRKQAEKLAARTAEREKIIKQTPRVLGTNAAVNASNKTSDQIRTGLNAVKTVVKDIVAPPGQKIADKPTRVEPTLDVDKKLSSGDNKSTRVEPTLDVDKKPESKTGSASEKGTPFNKVLNPNNPSTEPGSLRNKVNAAKAASAASEVKSPRLKRFSIGAGLAMMVPAAIELYQNRNKDKEKPAEPEPAKPAASAPALPAAPATNARANFAATDSRKDAMAANVEPVKAKQVRPDNGDSGSSGSVAGKKIDANTPQYKQPTTPPAEKQEPAAPPPPTPPAPVKATPPPPPAPAAVKKPVVVKKEPPPEPYPKSRDYEYNDKTSPSAANVPLGGTISGFDDNDREKVKAFKAKADREDAEKSRIKKLSGAIYSDESVQSKARSASFVFEKIRNITEGRPSQRHPLEGHDYHKKSNDELIYIAKDAHKAAEAMKGHNTTAENKYRDQANDSATVRYYRQKSGMPDWYKKKYGHMKEDVMEAKEKTEYDYEGDMARGQLQSIISNAQKVHDMLEDNDNLAEWVQSKITLAEDYISTVANYMMSEVDEEVQIDELSSELLGRYKKSSGAQASAADKSGDYAKANKRFSGIMKATKKQFANDTKQGVAEGATGAKPGFMLRQDPALAEWIDEAGPGLWANIHAKRQRIKQGSKERMRNPGEKGAPESGALEKARGTNEEVKGEYERKVDKYLKKKYTPDDNKPPFDAPYAKMPKADKSGAVHSLMSRAKHLAKMAGRKQAGIKEDSHDGQDNINTPAKRSLSKTAGMVKSILKGAKTKNKNLDKFESDPELSSQIVKQE